MSGANAAAPLHRITGGAECGCRNQACPFGVQLDNGMLGSGAPLCDFSHSSEQTRIMVIWPSIPFLGVPPGEARQRAAAIPNPLRPCAREATFCAMSSQECR
jgi:hypothetical protein